MLDVKGKRKRGFGENIGFDWLLLGKGVKVKGSVKERIVLLLIWWGLVFGRGLWLVVWILVVVFDRFVLIVCWGDWFLWLGLVLDKSLDQAIKFLPDVLSFTELFIYYLWRIELSIDCQIFWNIWFIRNRNSINPGIFWHHTVIMLILVHCLRRLRFGPARLE